MCLMQLQQEKRIKNYQNFIVKDLKDHFITMNIKQKARKKIGQMNIDIFSNEILLGSIACFFQFIQDANAKRFKDRKYDLPKI